MEKEILELFVCWKRVEEYYILINGAFQFLVS